MEQRIYVVDGPPEITMDGGRYLRRRRPHTLDVDAYVIAPIRGFGAVILEVLCQYWVVVHGVPVYHEVLARFVAAGHPRPAGSGRMSPEEIMAWLREDHDAGPSEA